MITVRLFTFEQVCREYKQKYPVILEEMTGPVVRARSVQRLGCDQFSTTFDIFGNQVHYVLIRRNVGMRIELGCRAAKAGIPELEIRFKVVRGGILCGYQERVHVLCARAAQMGEVQVADFLVVKFS